MSEPSPFLRPAVSDDAAAVARIWRDGWHDGQAGNLPDELVAARNDESFDSRAPQRVDDTTVAVVDGDVAGFVMVVADEVEQVYVAADHRGSAVAAALLAEAERVVADGGHDQAWPHYMPNLHIGVLRDTVAETARQELNWVWSRRAAFGPDDWSLIFAVVLDGEVIGMQDIHATEFPVTRTINSGSFLRADMRGRGLGVRMRALVLELAFGHLGAKLAKSGYMSGNDASRRVSEQFGYEPDGFGGPYVYEGEAYEDFAVRLTAERWAAHRPDWLDDLQITGLEPCLEIMGLQP